MGDVYELLSDAKEHARDLGDIDAANMIEALMQALIARGQ